MAASAGTMLAAALETGGYYGQELVLNNLAGMYTGIAAILFTATIMIAIAVTALKGQYKVAVWFFVGPGLFFFIVGNRSMANPTEWSMGAFKGDPAAVAEKIGSSRPANVAWLFAMYNNLISSMVQEMNKALLNDDIKRQMLFMTRSRIMDEIFRTPILDANLTALVKHGVEGECGREFEAARKLAEANAKLEEGSALDYIRTSFDFYLADTVDRTVTVSPNLAAYLINLFQAVQAKGVAASVGERWCNLDDAGLDGSVNVHNLVQQGQSCKRIWCWTGIAFAQAAHATMKNAENKFIDKQYTPTNIQEEIWSHIAVKMTPADLADFGITDPKSVTPDPSVIPAMISGILLRKAMTSDPRSQAFTQFAKHSGVVTKPVNFDPNSSLEEFDVHAQKALNHSNAEGLRWETFHFAMTLPYIQGFLLYIAAVSFPFFAILLVIPGKAQGFFTWLTLWAWLKSWDVGWALVYVADDIMWNLMPQTAVFVPDKNPNYGVMNLFEAAFQGDPSYSLTTYYMVISVMLTGVPLVSAQAVLGAKAAVAGSLINGAKSMSEKLGGWNSDYVSTVQGHKTRGLSEKFRINWSNRQFKNAINRDVAARRNSATDKMTEGQQDQSSGKTMGTTGGILMGIGVGAALIAGTFLTGGTMWLAIGAAAAVTAAGTGTYVTGETKFKSGIEKERAGNNAMAILTTTNGQAWSERANYTRAAFNLGGLQQAIMNRGQYYDPVFGQTQLHTDLVAVDMILQGRGGEYADAYQQGGQHAAVREGAEAAATVLLRG